MLETSARLLRLLSLLSARPFWRGDDLAGRLEVTPRTLRRDVARLRAIGYPVDADPGPAGGYRLGPGGQLPPLLLEDDEAVAVAVGLRTAAAGSVAGIEPAAVAALAKLEQVLPQTLRHRVAALGTATVALPSGPADVDPATLLTLAQCCRGLERVRMGYTDHAGRVTERTVEPYRLVAAGRRWYLVARDVRIGQWRNFRVDRIADLVATGHRFILEEEPPDAAALVAQGSAVAPYRYQARVRVEAPAADVAREVPATVAVVEPDGPDRALMKVGADNLRFLAGHLVALPWDFEVLEPDELRSLLLEVGRRLTRAHRKGGRPAVR